MDWWPWSSKEAIGQKNLQNHIDRVEAELKTLRALNSKDNSWTATSVNTLEDLNITNNITLQALKENKETLPAGTLPAGTLPAGTLPAGTLPAGNHDLTNGGTRKKRKNKKHKKKTYRH